MHYYFTAVSLIAGICLGFGILYLFGGLRRKNNKPLNLTFALFALCYAATLINGIRWYSSTTAAEYIAITRFDALFVTGAFVGLIWYISFYTGFRPRIFLWVLSAAFLVPTFVLIISPATFLGEVSGLINIFLPWGEKLANLDSSGSVWFDIHLLARLITLGYIILALIWQFRRGEHQPAILLGLGIFPFIAGILYEVLGESGFLPFIPLGEVGFLGIAIAASLQMANEVIKTEEALEQHRHNLKGLVEDRTTELEHSNFELTQEISHRKRVEAALRKSERQTRALLDAPPDTAMLVTPDGVILATNQIGATRLGFTVEEAIGKNVFDVFEAEISASRQLKKEDLIKNKQPIRWEDQRGNLFFRNNMYPILDENNEVESVAIFAVDITEQKLFQEKELESVAADERSRLARDLHDAVTQTIYAASLIVESLPQVWERNPEEGHRNLTKLRALIRGALAEMRSLLFELRPDSLENASMDTLIQFIADAFTGRTRVPVNLKVDGHPNPPPNVKTAFYRITQEVFNNIAKHAEATLVDVDLSSKDGEMTLTIQDNGIGFDPGKLQSVGMGLSIMQERANEVHTKLQIDCQLRQGSKVCLHWEATDEEVNDG
jgi:PAS domain S-box-containing protein